MSAINQTHATSSEEPQKAKPAEDVWQINICDEKVLLKRLENGMTVESYRPTDKAKAIQDIISILRGLDPMRDYSSAQNEKNVSQPFQMSVSQAAKIGKNLNKVVSCAIRVTAGVDQPSAKYSDEHNASIKQKREAFEQTDIFKKAVQIGTLAEEALNLIQPTELL